MFTDSGLGVLWWGKAIYNSQMGSSTLSYEMKTKNVEGSWCTKAFMFLICFTAFHHQGIKIADLGTVRCFGGFIQKGNEVDGFYFSFLSFEHLDQCHRVGSKSWVHSGIDNKHTNLPPSHFFLHGHVTKAADCLKLETERVEVTMKNRTY